MAETTALGAAYMAGLAAGVWDSPAEISERWSVDAEFEPRMSRDEADSLYDGWKKAVERSRGWAEQ
jgi:glycerol kinase